MSEQFYKGRTNNHLTWVMVNATNFASPESALSATTKIKIYGKLKSATGVNFVSSGTGSLTNDIQHVGASALGIYTIALVKADLSDASAAWYDQYIISLSATGAAYQTLVADGGIDNSYFSQVDSDLYSLLSDLQSDFQSRVTKKVATDSQLSDLHSDLKSYLTVMSGIQSDIYSAALLIQSLASDAHSAAVVAQGLNASDLSDIRSAISAGPTGAVTVSDISDIASAVWANAIGSDVNSKIVKLASRITKAVATNSQVSDLSSDLKSYLTVMSGILSDTYSAMLLTQSMASDAHSAAVLANSAASDAASGVTVLLSRITGAVATASDVASKVWAEALSTKLVQLNTSDLSDLRSAIAAGPAATITASDISDIASAVWANAIGSDVNSKVVKLASRITKAVATNSQLSDLASDLKSAMAAAITASDISDIASAVRANLASDISDILSAAQQTNSRVLLTQSMVSDVYSALTTARAEPAQGTPAATLGALSKLDYLYKAWRNRTTQTATGYNLFNDDAVTVDHKAATSDDGTTFSRGEVATGP